MRLRVLGYLTQNSAHTCFHILLQYCFRVEWPDKYAPSHGSSVELGFDTQQQAQEWHEQISAQITALGGNSSGNSLAAHYRSSSISGSMYGPGMVSVDPSPFTSPVSSFPVSMLAGLLRNCAQ